MKHAPHAPLLHAHQPEHWWPRPSLARVLPKLGKDVSFLPLFLECGIRLRYRQPRLAGPTRAHRCNSSLTRINTSIHKSFASCTRQGENSLAQSVASPKDRWRLADRLGQRTLSRVYGGYLGDFSLGRIARAMATRRQGKGLVRAWERDCAESPRKQPRFGWRLPAWIECCRRGTWPQRR